MNSWCEICARKKECYGITLKPKCFVPTADRKTKPTISKMEQVEDEPQTDGILFKGNLKEGDYKLIKTTDGWVLANEDIVYCGWERSDE